MQLILVFTALLAAQAALGQSWAPEFGGGIPALAFAAGHDASNTLYVCRVSTAGGTQVGKYSSASNCVYYANGSVTAATSQVLTDFSVEWVSATNGSVPSGAYNASASGGSVYICRAYVENTLQVGQLVPGTSGCAIEYSQTGGLFSSYEVATNPWVAASNGTIPAGAMRGGTDSDNTPLYICRGMSGGARQIGKIRSDFTNCRSGNLASPIYMSSYEVLTSISASWQSNNLMPPNSSPWIAGYTGGQPKYSCRFTVVNTTALTPGQTGGTDLPSVCGVEYGDFAHASNSFEILSKTTIPGACLYNVSPTAFTAPAGGGTQTITVSGGCGWVNIPLANWITADKRVGTGGSFVLTISPNNSGATRIGQVTVGGQTITITQPPPCGYTLSPSPLHSSAAGNSMNVSVTTGAGCAWTAITPANWFQIVDGAGTGSGGFFVNFSFNATGSPRSSVIIVGGTSLTVNQDAACLYTVTPAAPGTVSASGGSISFTPTTATSCSATLSSSAWIVTTPGQTPGQFTATIAPNTIYQTRTGSITSSTGQTITITQLGPPCTVGATPSPVVVPTAGGPFQFTVNVPASSCQWTATEGSSFVHLNPPASGTGSRQISGTVDANPSNSARTGTITFTSYLSTATATVNQSGTTCSYTISPLTVFVPAAGISQTVTITAPTGCTWTAVSGDTTWITFPSSSSGSGSGTFSFNASGNPNGTSRSTTISVGGQSISITQAASTCSYTLNSTGTSVAAAGRSDSVSVNAPTGCAWTVTVPDSWVTIGSGLSGSGNGLVLFTVLANVSANPRTSTLSIAGKSYTITQSGTGNGNNTGMTFVALPPCRILETRDIYNFEGRTGVFGPPFLTAGETRTLPMTASNVCSIPATAKAYVVNITLVPRGSVDFVTLWPAGDPRPNVWSIRSPDGNIVANSAIVKAGANGAISLYTSSNTDLLIDVSGYFTDNTAISNLVYYPLTPCRVIDTRIVYRAAGPFGAPSMGSRETRSFRFPAYTPCGVPNGAAAYSMTITAVPTGPLQFLTAWPGSTSQPNVSSINSPAGRVLANSVILPVSVDGTINVMTFDASDFLIDINGYFAPDDGSSGQFYFPVTQCRASDSTLSGGIYADDTARTIDIPSAAGCSGIPSNARGFALNVTALPSNSPMPFLTAYPTGQQRPNASILNAFEGQIVTNSAIVPAGIGGAIDIYAYRHTNVVVEIYGYFGR